MNYIPLILWMLACNILAEEDGYTLFINACNKTKLISDSWDKEFKKTLNNCIETQAIPNAEISKELAKVKPILELIHKSRNSKTWNAPDDSHNDMSTVYPEIKYWRNLGLLATLVIQSKIRENKFDDALNIIIDFKTVGQLHSRSNIMITHLLRFSVEKKFYLYNDMSIFDKCSLSNFTDINKLSNNQTSIEEFLIAEKHHCVNTIKNMVFKDLCDIQKALIKTLSKNGYDKNLVSAVEKGELLSIKQWKNIAIKNYIKSFDYRMDLYKKTPPSKLVLLTKKFDEEDNKIKQMDELIKSWQSKLSKITNKEDITGLQELHSSVGEEISLILNNMFLFPAGTAILKLKEYQSYERLIIIHMAKRIYFEKMQTPEKELQDLVDQGILSKEMIVDPLSQKTFLMDDKKQVYGVGLDFDDDLGIPYDRHKKDGDIILFF